MVEKRKDFTSQSALMNFEKSRLSASKPHRHRNVPVHVRFAPPAGALLNVMSPWVPSVNSTVGVPLILMTGVPTGANTGSFQVKPPAPVIVRVSGNPTVVPSPTPNSWSVTELSSESRYWNTPNDPLSWL